MELKTLTFLCVIFFISTLTATQLWSRRRLKRLVSYRADEKK